MRKKWENKKNRREFVKGTFAVAGVAAVRMNVDGLDIKVISLDDLIVNKRASGRPKDIADALALEKLKARNGNG